MRQACLEHDFVGVDGLRYCFKRDPSVTLLIEQEADAVARDESRVRARIRAGKIIELFRVGADGAAPGIPTAEVVAGFFSFLGFPRLRSAGVVRAAIARGVETGLFGYATARPPLGGDGRYQLGRSRVAFERAVTAGRDKLYDAWNALSNLADLAGEITISAKAANPAGPLDPAKLEHSVLEPLRELGLLDDDAT